MVNKCCVPGCRSGYDAPDSHLTFHCFPSDPDLLDRWKRAIPRDTSCWEPSHHSRICSLHFHDHDYQSNIRTDHHSTRRKQRGETKTRKSLRKGVLPTVFPNLPSYLSTHVPEPRATTSTAAARREREDIRHEEAVQEFFDRDTIQTFDQLHEKAYSLELPSGIDVVRRDDMIMFLSLARTGGKENYQIEYYLEMTSSLEYEMVVKNNGVPKSKVKHINGDATIKTFSAIGNILAFLKSLNHGNNQKTMLAILCDNLKNEADIATDITLKKKLLFVSEQLFLCQRPPNTRKYSADLLVAAMMWKTTSTALYRQLRMENCMTLPSISHLTTLSKSLTTDTGLSTSSVTYLKTRFSRLSNREMKVVLMMDEIYCAQRIEYARGQFFGGQNEEVCKTLLCFMIKSIAGKYSDIVSLCPVKNLDSVKIKEEFDIVLDALTNIGFEVVATSVDNATPNRKFYTNELCQGTLQSSIEHPLCDNTKIYLLFDSVHNFKNVYNNFHTRKVFVFPSVKEPGSVQKASFFHIEQLYNMELGKPVKMAYKLNDKVLHPSNIEKTNVQLADSLFHDSTIEALRFYAREEDYANWKDTADFWKVIRNWWNILNVKTPYHGMRKRNKFMEPVSKTNTNNLDILLKFSQWLEDWRHHSKENHQRSCLTDQTFLATIQTTKAIIQLTNELIELEDFTYVLLGNLQSDPIEKRFGWYRQLAGANYFISVRQILEAEKSIRIRSLMKFSGLNFSEVKEAFKEVDMEKEEHLMQECVVLLGMFEHEISEFTQEQMEDANIIYYIAGCYARSLCKQVNCEECAKLLKKNDNVPQLAFDPDTSEEIGELRKTFLDQVNRGGLCHPTDLAYLSCLHSWRFYKDLKESASTMEFLLASEDPRRLFAVSLMSKCSESEETQLLLSQSCQSGHVFSKLFQKLSIKMFNTFAKNLCSERNSRIHQQKRRSNDGGDGRKIRKLQSSN